MVNGATAFFCFCIVAIYSIDGYESKKFKRDAFSGLVSFPRIGKGDPLWRIGPEEVKRQSLVSFPRTGKRGDPGDLSEDDQYKDVPWFGSEKKEIQNGKIWALVQIKDLILPPNPGNWRVPGEETR